MAIDNPAINSVESIEVHSDLFVLMTSLSDSVYYLFSINLSDGSVLLSRKLDGISSLDSGIFENLGYFSSMLAPRASDIYLAVKFTDESEMGFLRL